MATYEHGDMFSVYGNTDLFLVTTNPIINRDGELVMGRGIAKQLRDSFPGAAATLADLARTWPDRNVVSVYEYRIFGDQHVGFFMVKDHWQQPARIPIIMRSVAELMDIASTLERVDLNFPGIGNGKLTARQVKPLLDYLPDNVHIWRNDL